MSIILVRVIFPLDISFLLQPNFINLAIEDFREGKYKAATKCRIPKCEFHAFAKGHWRSTKRSIHTPTRSSDDRLRMNEQKQIQGDVGKGEILLKNLNLFAIKDNDSLYLFFQE